MRPRNKASGFSLLEVIVVLAIVGGALVMYTNYARKQAAKEMRQTIANALVQEMKGVVNYLRDETLQTKGGEKDNPFYDSNGASANDAHYRYRITNSVNDINTGKATDYFLWGDDFNAQKQQRYLFISKSCNTSLKSEFELTTEYLPCSLVTAADNPAAKIDRIGFTSDDLTTPSSTVSRMDVIVAFAYTDGGDKYSFANYASAFNNALNNAGLIASHIMIVRRKTSVDAWQLVTKADGTTPVEFSDMASNLKRLEKAGAGQQLGIRLTFDMNDNDSGSGGNAGNMCWNSTESKVELCYDQEPGTGVHGEDRILALNMTDQEDQRGDRVAGTLKANLVMENTSRPVFIFKRRYGGDLWLAADGNPERFTYTNNNNEEIEGEFYLDDNTSSRPWNGYSIRGWDTISDYYPSRAYDAFELVTPSVSEYSGTEYSINDITGKQNYIAEYDDSNKMSGWHRFAVQACPAVEQEIILRDANGEAILDNEGNKKTVKIVRKLYPRLSASISSVSAYNDGTGTVDMYTKQSETRKRLRDSKKLDMLGGVTVQVELAEQDVSQGISADHNSASKYIYPGGKYIWAVTAVIGMYDSETGLGHSIENPPFISYVITKWCSTIPQSGTPQDLLSTTTYK
ncbi:prepilin-type N-terminal cleavage/methylation domain-containing protein [Citrobacter rodentium]|uniref:Type IV pilus biogenesis protein n=2 Tax=Citrobacter rodentium TaxID=67825 RepID=D2TPA9_CITRI|nr:prepilin-type N-terminal cleavage/methylation domain-containing protein [Citrobacter rodentium]KIQ49911.1 hypothetical protein TA05_18365 [Citrobacter rodentium]QBY30904.1 prepilin-type N-terminal cleavage/methylation domain-containing protein [Citrobacter rodentium]UHO31730.1 prepilin-type N-terminal cleavage/methylation domain-containing protein [Citrobacter rodentium NBRC 105723 = DSM 16636]CBG91342.1 putative Type IV pilus biogenesis protein [Citrobacter rodentium ICC168]HAT8012168.1 hy